MAAEGPVSVLPLDFEEDDDGTWVKKQIAGATVVDASNVEYVHILVSRWLFQLIGLSFDL